MLFLSLACFSHAHAHDAHKKAIIQEILVQTNFRLTLARLRLDNIEQTRKAQIAQAGDKANNPMMIRLIQRSQEKYAEYMDELYDYSRMEKIQIAIYEELFTEPELEGLLAFYKTDAGHALIRATPQIMQKMQTSLFEGAGKREARVKQIMDESIAEIQAELKAEGKIP